MCFSSISLFLSPQCFSSLSVIPPDFFFPSLLSTTKIPSVSSTPTSLHLSPPPCSTQSWWPPQSVVCLTKLSMAVCQSHINSQPWGEKQSRAEGSGMLLWDGHMSTHFLLTYIQGTLQRNTATRVQRHTENER